MSTKLYHSGIRKPVARSTLADANESRDWRIFADFAQVLTQQASTLYADEPFQSELKAAAYALDSTTIDLCLSLFPWATFRKTKAAIKLHTLLKAGREDIACRLSKFCFVRVHQFDQPDMEPEHLTDEQVQQLVGGIL